MSAIRIRSFLIVMNILALHWWCGTRGLDARRKLCSLDL